MSEACPRCRRAIGAGGSCACRGPGLLTHARALEAALDPVVATAERALLARVVDAGGALARDGEGPVAAAELSGLLTRLTGHDGALGAIDRLLGATGAEAPLLALDPGALLEGARGRELVQKGLVLLRHQRHRDALDWWRLQREALGPSEARLALVLLVMEAVTWQLAGDAEQARAAQARVRSHPVYQDLRAKARTRRNDR